MYISRQSKAYILSILLFLLFQRNIEAELPKLITKQAPPNIVFLSQDGKFTYYQNRSGGLFLSHNYQIHKVFQGNSESMFNMYGTISRKRIVLGIDSAFHTQNSYLRNNALYLLNFGETKLSKIGEGISPRLHLNDSWVSFFDPLAKIIHFRSIEKLGMDFQVRIKNPVNVYFIPEVVMLDEGNIYFTDLNRTGHSAIIHLNRNSQHIAPLFKTEMPGIKIELCFNKTELFFGQFGLADVAFGSEINRIDLTKTKDFSKIQNLYKSFKNDYGNMECENEDNLVYFVQDQGETKSPAQVKTEVVSLHTQSGALKTLSEMKYVSHIINMDGRILLPFRSELYVIKGQSTLPQDALKKFEPKN